MTTPLASPTPPFKAVSPLPEGARFMRRKEVEEITGLSCSGIYKNIKNGTFPAPVSIGGNAVAWISSEIAEWCRQRIAERNRKRSIAPSFVEARP